MQIFRILNQNQLFKILLIFLLLRYTTQTKLEQKYMRVVDTLRPAYEDSGKFNVIFRSNIPEDESGTIFEYEKLLDYMVKVAKSERRLRIEKEKVYIIDYTLLKVDDPLRKTEEKFWKENPSKGQLMGWSVLGERLNPEDYSIEQIIAKSKKLDWMRDDIEQWVDEIHSSATTFRNDSNVMLLVHCHHGRDRAGEINGAYQLKYAGRTWQEVIATNYRMYSAHIKYENHRALTWFCYHLQYHRNYTHLQCTNENLSSENKKVPSLVGWDVEEDNDHSNSWMVAFYSVLGSSILGLFAFLIVFIIIVLIMARGFIRRKVNDVGAKFKKLLSGSDHLDTANQINSKIGDAAGDLDSI